MAMGLPLKFAVVSAAVLSTAVMLKLSTPFITELAINDFATVWTYFISWFKPPYLYVVINCIIITIVASSRLQSKHDCSHSIYTLLTEPVFIQTGPVKGVLPVELPPVHELDVPFHNGVWVKEPVEIVGPKFVKVLDPDFSTHPRFSDEDMKIATNAYEEIKKNTVNKSIISMSAWTRTKIDQVDLPFPVEKLPTSARFSHRKPAKSNSKGGRTLKVTKPKRQDTLETTWKTITESRSVPLMRKSDTFESQGQGHNDHNSNNLPIENYFERMTKSDTFDVSRNGGGSGKPLPPRSKLNRGGGSGRLRKEP